MMPFVDRVLATHSTHSTGSQQRNSNINNNNVNNNRNNSNNHTICYIFHATLTRTNIERIENECEYS